MEEARRGEEAVKTYDKIVSHRLIISGGKSTENLYSSTSAASLLKYYSITSKSTGVRKIAYSSKSTEYASKNYSEYYPSYF